MRYESIGATKNIHYWVQNKSMFLKKRQSRNVK